MRSRLFVLIMVLLLWVSPGWADITLGVIPATNSLFYSLPQAQQFAAYLEKRLGEPVALREFFSVADLHQDLTRSQQVDIAVLPVYYLCQQPPGEFAILATVVPTGMDAADAAELVVARRDLKAGRRNRIEVVLTAMAGDPEGAPFLGEVGVARLLGAKIDMPVDLSPTRAFVSCAPMPVAHGAGGGEGRSTLYGSRPGSISSSAESIAAGGGGLEDLGASAPVQLEADELFYDKPAALYRATGEVQMRKGAVLLTADQMTYNEAAASVQASGQVHLTDPGGEMRADQLDYALDSGLGRMTSGRVFVKEHNFHLAGAEIEKIGGNTYTIEDGTFTTCNGPDPSWKFGASHIDVTLGKYAQARNVLFYLHDVPVLYLPYLAYPVKTERESGFLMPRFGYSDKRGVELSLAYYQVIDRNQDATLYVDYLSDFGFGQGLEYRYIFGADNEGVFKGYYLNDVKDKYLRDKAKDNPELADSLDESDRYAIEWNHFGTLPYDWHLSADVEYVSNRDYFDEFGKVAEEYNKDQTESVVYLSHSWQNATLAGELNYTQDLKVDDDSTLQRLPDIHFDLLRQRIADTPFFFKLDSSYTYFYRREEIEDRVKGHRLNVRPALSAFFTPFDWLEIVPEIGYRERVYRASDGGSESEGLYDFSTRISTSLARVYPNGFGPYEKLRHTIDPEIIYSYIPHENQDRLPRFDYLDRIGSENRIEYGFTSRLTARLEPELGAPDYLDVLYLRLAQSFDFRESRQGTAEDTEQDPFSEIRGELILQPTRSLLFDLDARYDPYDTRLHTFNVYSGWRDGAGNSVGFDYRYFRHLNEYFSGYVNVAWLAPFYLGYEHRYDFTDQRTLEKVLNIEYRAQCWSVLLSLRDRLEDKEYMLTFALSGIGNVLNMGGGLGGGGGP